MEQLDEISLVFDLVRLPPAAMARVGRERPGIAVADAAGSDEANR
jgi:hypothetical protein